MRPLSSTGVLRLVSAGQPFRGVPLKPPSLLPRCGLQTTFLTISTRPSSSLARPPSPFRIIRNGPFLSRHNASMQPPPRYPEARVFTPISPNSRFSRRHPLVGLVLRLGISSVVGVVLIVGIILAHDAFTYSERHADRVPANPLSLHPRTGGKKNLPIIESNLDDEQDETMRSLQDKPRLVIVGGGWGVSAFLALNTISVFLSLLLNPSA